MTMRLVCLAGVGLLAGCVGHLEFEPHLDAGGGTPSGNNSTGSSNNPIGGDNTNSGDNGTGGAVGGYASDGSGGQSAPSAGSGGDNGYGSGSGGAWADAAAPAASDDGGGAADDAGAPTTASMGCPTGVNVLTDVFAAKCGACHGAAAPTKNLDMVSAGLGARMVNKPSSCKNLPLISGTLTNGNPTGLLFQKLAGKVTGCGVQMPAGGTPLSASEMACVNSWAVAAIAKVTGGK
ncbi:MAG TPA: hypothetical protein VMU50_22645 [Polyangia bacterium]|nr:hypothetical protein [Polyangia bacterium]